MPHPLAYAALPTRPWRRRALFAALILLSLAGAYFIAWPRLQQLQAYYQRRQEVREQIAAQLDSAQQALARNDPDAAALALIRAQFARHVDAHFLANAEPSRYEAQIATLRTQLLPAVAKAAAIRKAEEARLEAQREAELKAMADRGVEMTRDRFCRIDARQLLDSLEEQAVKQLRQGNNPYALSVCEQIVLIDPSHGFPATFWANVPSPK